MSRTVRHKYKMCCLNVTHYSTVFSALIPVWLRKITFIDRVAGYSVQKCLKAGCKTVTKPHCGALIIATDSLAPLSRVSDLLRNNYR